MTTETSTPLRVVVVTYNPGMTLTTFLDTLAHATKRPLDVIAADNGSSDGRPQIAANARRLALLQTGANIGYGRAANLGAAATSDIAGPDSEWILIANPDLAWDPGSVDELLAATTRWPKAAAFGPAIVTPDGQPYPSARSFPSVKTGVGHALFAKIWPKNPWTRAYHHGRSEPGEGPTGWLSGAALLVRRDVFEQLHGFDPGYFMFFEDVDLCERMAKAGWERIYVPTARVVHIGGASWRTSRSAQMTIEHHRSAARYIDRKYNRWYQLPLRLALRAGLVVRGGLAAQASRTAK